MSEHTPSRVLVIGFDGATWDLAEKWANAGHLPALASLMQRGSYGPLRSVMPVLSPAAWTSFATGVYPGRHGIFDFAQRGKDSYDLRLVTARDIHATAFWTLASQSGKRVGVVNVPLTYPATPVNGIMVTGLGTPDGRSFTYPEELSNRLLAQGYRVNKTMFFEPGREQVYLRDTYETIDKLAATAMQLYRSESWDAFVVVFRDVDEVSHYFWKYMDSSHPAHDPGRDAEFSDVLLRFYQHLDGKLGEFVEVAGPETDIVLVSDHGFGPLYKDVFLNEWLRQEGFLTTALPVQSMWRKSMIRTGLTRERVSRLLQRIGLARLERRLHASLGSRKELLPSSDRAAFPDCIDWSQTRCYSYGYHGQVFVNLAGREPAGIVHPGAEYEATLTELEEKLAHMVDPTDGQPVISRMVRGETLFGRAVDTGAPDLVLLMRDLAYITRQGYEFGTRPGVVFGSPANHETGSHREMGVGLFAGPSFVKSKWHEAPSIVDVAPTILHLLGVSGSDMDGRVLAEILSPSHRAATSPMTARDGVPLEDAGEGDTELTDEEVQELTDRLRRLGYLG